jgi:uncharacterized protein (TIGR03437 family)
LKQTLLSRFIPLAVILPALTLPSYAALTYTCDPNIDAAHAGTCDFLNNTIAGIYNKTFTNISAGIYIQYGQTGLGQSTVGFDNQVTYSAFVAALTAASQASGNSVQQAAVKTLNSFDIALYGSGMVDTPSALLAALGIPNSQGVVFGTTADLKFCATPGSGTCYNGIITITNDPGTHLYFRSGTQSFDSYDFYAIAEHETDEILGTSSCISTGGSSLNNGCPGTNTPAAVDLFRFQTAGTPVLMSTTPGAFFSFDGQTNGAGKNAKVYNTLSNGDDYADFLSSNPCSKQQSIQDAAGCPGFDGNLDITNDGGAEINILNAIGYKLSAQASTPAPNISNVQNGASFQIASALAPGTFLAVYGSNLSTTPAAGRTWAAADFLQNADGTFKIPTNLDGTSVTVGGIPGYVYYVSPTQLNIITPSTIPPGSNVPVVVSVKGQPSAAFNVNLTSLAPAFFAYYPGTANDGKYLIAQHLPSYTDVGKVGLYPTAPANFTTPAKPGETIQLYGTGFGPTTPPIPAGIETPNSPTYSVSATATLGDQPATVVFAGLTPTLSQIYQVDVTIPASATAGLASGATKDLPLVVTVNGVKSFSGLITVQAP